MRVKSTIESSKIFGRVMIKICVRLGIVIIHGDRFSDVEHVNDKTVHGVVTVGLRIFTGVIPKLGNVCLNMFDSYKAHL